MKARLACSSLFSLILLVGVYCQPPFLYAQGSPEFELCPSPNGISVDAPSALAVDAEENLYVADATHHRLLIYDKGGLLLHTLPGLAQPISVAVDKNGSIYAGDSQHDQGHVSVFAANHTFMFKLGRGDGEFLQPTAIAIADTGKIYVVDRKQDAIKVYHPDGTLAFSFGKSGSGNGQFNSPTAIAIRDNLVVVTDLQIIRELNGTIHEGARVQTFTLEGDFIRSFSPYGQGNGLLTKPLGVAMDAGHNVYVADSYQNVVQVFNPAGVYLTTVYDVNQPLRTALDLEIGPTTGRLYVASHGSRRVDFYCAKPQDLAKITASAGAGGWITSNTITVAQETKHGFAAQELQNLTFVISADSAAGYHLDRLVVDGMDILANPEVTILGRNRQQNPVKAEYTFPDTEQAHTIAAVFALNTYTLTVSLHSAVEGCGSITPAGPVTVTHGDSSTFTVVYDNAACGYADLLIDEVSLGPRQSQIFSSVTADHALKVVFTPVTHDIVASPLSEMAGAIAPAGVIAVDRGAEVTFTCLPNAGYGVDHLLVDNSTQVFQDSYTFTTVTANHSVHCQFRELLHTITTTVAGAPGCAVSPAGSVPVADGANRTFFVSPADGYCVTDLQVDESSLGSQTSHTFYTINTDHTLQVACARCPANRTPVAEAGPNQVAGCGEVVQMIGANSYDHDPDDRLTFQWEQLSGTAVSLSDAADANPVFTAPECGANEEAEPLQFQLTVRDDLGAAGLDSCTVNVGRENIPPWADAGPDRNVAELDAVMLEGSGSQDPDGEIVSYFWEQTGGRAVQLSDHLAVTPGFTAPLLDSSSGSEPLTFKLTVRDETGALAEDDCIVNVSLANAPPVARAECPASAVAAGETVTLNGSGSDDRDGGIASFSWRQTATGGATPVIFAGPTKPTAAFVAPYTDLAEARLSFTLTVADHDGALAADSCNVVVTGSGEQGGTNAVEPIPNHAPHADAGIDQTAVRHETVTLDGGNSWDQDGNIASYRWRQTVGPRVRLSAPTTAKPLFRAPAVGVNGDRLVFELMVTDAEGLKATDLCAITVTPAAPPATPLNPGEGQGSPLKNIRDNFMKILVKITSLLLPTP